MGKIGLLALALLVTNLWADTYICKGIACGWGHAILSIDRDGHVCKGSGCNYSNAIWTIDRGGDETYVCNGAECSSNHAVWTISGGRVSTAVIISILYANGMLDISNNQSTSTSKSKSNSGTRYREKSWSELGREMYELGLAIENWAGADDPAARREQQQISETI